MADLKVGDVVKLNSGSPRMTIQELGTYDFGPGAYCRWFDEKEPKENVFPLAALQLVPMDKLI
jgi:uncharacterized protein YodC (DUF2158 family)